LQIGIRVFLSLNRAKILFKLFNFITFQNCSLLQHHVCNSSFCIARSKFCDGDPDCDDKSDETACVCSPTYFTCADGLCIDRVL